jgi:hypothetical protein
MRSLSKYSYRFVCILGVCEVCMCVVVVCVSVFEQILPLYLDERPQKQK